MDSNSTLRSLYYVGNYSEIVKNYQKEKCSIEGISLIWKSILRSGNGSGDEMNKCTKFMSTQSGTSDLFKQSIILWSKVFLKPTSSERDSFKELAGKAYEAAEIAQEEREQIILNSIEGLLILNCISEAFSLLKLLKSSNLDW